MADEHQSVSSKSKDGGKNMQWMYEGTKSVLNREDYLLGKKIDKNFEMFSDVIVRDQEEEKRETFFQESILRPSTSASQQHKVSALDTRVVRTEDPLVALKLQEEKRRRHLLDNPLLKLKAQRVLRKAFEKELMKGQKKEKKGNKKRRKQHSSSSSSSSAEQLHHHHQHHRRKRGKEGRKQHSERRQEGVGRRKRSISGSSSRNGQRRASSTSKSRKGEESRRRRRRSSSSSSRRSSTRDQSRTAAGAMMTESGGRGEAKRTMTSPPITTTTKSATPPTTKKLGAHELEERRRAMLANANWRDEMRERNVREAADKLSKEQDEMMATNRSAGGGFLRPMMSTATEHSSIEKRLQSNRMNIQRQHDHMDKSFVKK